MAAVLELLAGSYEQITFGYQVKINEKVSWSLILWWCVNVVVFSAYKPTEQQRVCRIIKVLKLQL